MKVRYSDHIIEIVRLMLKFEEADRPSFIELSKLVLTSTENTLESPQGSRPSSNKVLPVGKCIGPIDRKVSKAFSQQNFKEGNDSGLNNG